MLHINLRVHRNIFLHGMRAREGHVSFISSGNTHVMPTNTHAHATEHVEGRAK